MTAVSLFSLDLMSYVVAREAAIRARAALMASARRWMSSDDSNGTMAVSIIRAGSATAAALGLALSTIDLVAAMARLKLVALSDPDAIAVLGVAHHALAGGDQHRDGGA